MTTRAAEAIRWIPARVYGWIHEHLPRLLPGGRQDVLPVTLDRKRIYILPTRAGVFFGLLLTVMLLGALNYNNNLTLMLTFLLAGVALIAPIHTHRNLAGLTVTGCHADPVFAGQPARFILHFADAASRDRCAVRSMTEHDSDYMDVPGNGTGQVTMSQPTRERGWNDAARIRVFSEYPLGMFHAWSWLDAPGRVLVYPAPETDAPPLPYEGAGGTSDLRREEEDEFVGLREYRTGDPSRLIAWKAVARADRLMSKAFLTPRRNTVWLDYSALGGLKPEARLSRLTAWVLEAHRQQVDYGFRLPGRNLAPSHTEGHRLRCLEALAVFRES